MADTSAIITHPFQVYKFSISFLSSTHPDKHLNKREKMEATSQQRFKRICVFCGSNSGNKPEFIEAAKELGRVIAEKNMHLVYGGGNLGLMGCISKAVQDGGGHVLGIIPKPLAEANLIGPSNGEELIVSGMSEQIQEMINTSDVFIALPGGLGTFEEMFTVASWAHLNIHRKPIGLLNIEHFFNFLFVFLAEAKRHEFITKSVDEIFPTATKAEELIDQILTFEPKPDTILSKLNWSDSDRDKKRKLDIDLNR